jgi:drug/metabolite transporter (DMT)-like permease
MTPTMRAVAAMVVCQMAFGGYGIIFKPWAGRVDTLIFCLFRDVGAFIVLLAVSTVREGWCPPPKRDAWFFGLTGLLGMTGGQVLYLIGVAECGPSVASIYQPLVPVFTALLAVLTGFEAILPCRAATVAKFAGIAMGSGGAVVMVTGSHSSSAGGDEEHPNAFFGNVMLVGQCFATAIYILLQKKFVYAAPEGDERRQRWLHKPLSLTAWSYCSGAVCMLCIAGPRACSRPEIVTSIPLSVLEPLCYAVFVTSALGYALITYANSILPASITSSFWPLQVLVATTLASYFFGAVVGVSDALGGALIVGGMFVIAWSNHQLDSQSLSHASAGGGAEGGVEGGGGGGDMLQMDDAAAGITAVLLSPEEREQEHEQASAPVVTSRARWSSSSSGRVSPPKAVEIVAAAGSGMPVG